MDIKYLTYITTIANEKNMTKAAEKLFISQSSLSHYLSKLEAEIGVPLFLRGKSEMLPTPAGQMYVETAKKVIDMRNQLYKNISHLDNRGRIRISTTSYWGLCMMTDIIPKFKVAFPAVTFEMSQKDIELQYKMLNEGSLDFSLMSLESDNIDPETMVVLRKEELFFAISRDHPYCQKNPGDTITEKELTCEFSSDTFLLSNKSTANRRLADQLFRKYDFSPATVNEVTGILVTRDMVACGIGVAFIPLSGRKKDETVHYYHVDPPIYRYNILQHRKNMTLSPAEKIFFDYVVNYFK